MGEYLDKDAVMSELDIQIRDYRIEGNMIVVNALEIIRSNLSRLMVTQIEQKSSEAPAAEEKITLKDWMRHIYPECVTPGIAGCVGCPSDYKFPATYDYCKRVKSPVSWSRKLCVDCWNQICPEERRQDVYENHTGSMGNDSDSQKRTYNSG